jgi:sec-independent protein translocase protein TatB
MFDFGFSELLVVGVVALLVLGPTRLPGLVRKVGRWVGKARSMARDFREQLEIEVNVEELNRAVQRQVMDDPPSTEPPPAEAGASTPADATADAFSGSGYPYGVPTDTSSTSADPAVTAFTEPQPGDDTYSHAHAPGAAPDPWVPEPEPPAQESEPTGDDAGSDDTPRRDA